jgi:hypothetical protein
MSGAPASDWIISPKRFLLGAIAVGLLAAGAVGVAIFATSSKKASTAPPSPAQLKHRMLLALSASDDRIRYVVTEFASVRRSKDGAQTAEPSGRLEAWEDSSTGRLRETSYGVDGQVRSDTAISHSGNVTTTEWLIYSSHVWMTMTQQSPHIPSLGGGTGTAYRRLLESGAFRLVGATTINGAPVLYFRMSQGLPTPPSFEGAVTDNLWVDASTYLPVLQEMKLGSIVTSRTTYELLPRSAANLAKLDLAIPPGFTHRTMTAPSH